MVKQTHITGKTDLKKLYEHDGTIQRKAYPFEKLSPIKAHVSQVTNHHHDTIKTTKHPVTIYRDNQKSGVLSNGQRVYLEGGNWKVETGNLLKGSKW